MSFVKSASNIDTPYYPRVLLWSLRNIQNFVYNASLFEFEDVISITDSVSVLAPARYRPHERLLNRLLRTGTQWIRPAMYLSPSRQSVWLEDDYDLFFVALDFPKSIFSLNTIKNRRQKCKFSVCYIMEIWKSDIPILKNHIEFFRGFDAIFLGHAHVIDDVASITEKPCFYLPPGVDTLKFCPDFQKTRNIDVCNLGRRSSVTHEALINMVSENSSFSYHYDQSRRSSFRCEHIQKHRLKTASLLKDSRYFIVNYSKFDQPEKIQDQREFGYRFFEGAAAGNIMIGCPPNTPEFIRNFDWCNAVIPIRFDEPEIADFLHELDSDVGNLTRIQYNNVANALQRHDWVYRWRYVLDKIGLTSLPPMEARIQRLTHLAQTYQPPLEKRRYPEQKFLKS